LVIAGREGAIRRRSRRRDAGKAQIVEQSHAPGVKVADVARRHGVRPAELSRWRGLAREGRLPPVDGTAIAFATMVVEAAEPNSMSPETYLRDETVKVSPKLFGSSYEAAED
jgi:transposase